jgi:PleD family two-component response regulator
LARWQNQQNFTVVPKVGLACNLVKLQFRRFPFAISLCVNQAAKMTNVQPLALILYEKLLPGTQLVNRLQDLNYRVQSISQPDQLIRAAVEFKPLLVLADLAVNTQHVNRAIQRLRQEPSTAHLPVIAFCPDQAANSKTSAPPEGATLLVGETAVLNHLPEILERALLVE